MNLGCDEVICVCSHELTRVYTGHYQGNPGLGGQETGTNRIAPNGTNRTAPSGTNRTAPGRANSAGDKQIARPRGGGGRNRRGGAIGKAKKIKKENLNRDRTRDG